MFTTSERDKRVAENINEVSNVPYFSVVNRHNQRAFLSGSSPVSPASLQSSPSSSFSNGFSSPESDFRFLAPSSHDTKGHLLPSHHFLNAPCFDPNTPNVSHSFKMVDELGLSRSFNRMNVREVQNDGSTTMKGFDLEPSDVYGFHGGNVGFGDSVQYNVKKYGVCDDLSHGCYGDKGFQSSTLFSDSEKKCALDGLAKYFCDSNGCNQSNDLYSVSSWYNKKRDRLLEQRMEQGRCMSSNRGSPLQSQNPPTARSNLDHTTRCFQGHKLETDGGINVLGSSLLNQSKLDLRRQNILYENLMLRPRTTTTANNEIPQSLMSLKGAVGHMEAFKCEDSYILQGKRFNLSNKRPDSLRDQRKISSKEISAENMQEKSTDVLHGPSCEGHDVLGGYSTLPVLPTVNSLCEVKGYIIAMAQDQNGCRFLQRIFDEGTSDEIQMIFNGIISDIVELMQKPFGNYVIQKLLDVCSEEQRLQIVHMVTKESGQLVDVCLNTYGTRVIQKLIETLKTRQQISLVIMALKPGFLDLIKDQNGNHVIQRCLQCLGNEEKRFIFDAASKSCVEIATHRHGCCVMQRCIAHAMGKHREKLIVEVSKNGLLLAQDPFGNYVVQYVIELKSSSASAYMLSQFKGHYVQLSTQKFSSHVVEKCLKHFEESRSQIIRELLSVSHFEQLMQDPYANYVIQSALAITKGPLHSALVQAVQPHLILRTSPYCKRIFSRSLLKK